jgi:hypothetical protein
MRNRSFPTAGQPGMWLSCGDHQHDAARCMCAAGCQG